MNHVKRKYIELIMLNLILAIILGGIFAWFALANAAPVVVNIGGYLLSFPLYAVAFLSLLVGVAISALLSFTSWLGTSFALSSKDSQIRKEANQIADLKNHINALQIENAKLRGETVETRNEARLEKDLAVERAKLGEREHQAHPNFLDRLRYKLAI